MDGEMKITKKHIGKRLLVQEEYSYTGYIEIILLEISKSGKGKFQYLSGHISWEDIKDYKIIDVLPAKDEYKTNCWADYCYHAETGQ